VSTFEEAVQRGLVAQMIAAGFVKQDEEVVVCTSGSHVFMVEVKVLDVTGAELQR
jgi:hypothetical protein